MVIVSDLVMTFDPAPSNIVVAGVILCVEVTVTSRHIIIVHRQSAVTSLLGPIRVN